MTGGRFGRTHLTRWSVLFALIFTIAVPVPAGATQPAQTSIVSADPADYTPNIADPEHTHYSVQAIAKVGSDIVVGGEFSHVQNHNDTTTTYDVTNLFAFDASTGLIDQNFGFPVVDGRVNAMVPGADGRSVIVGGEFTSVDGKTAKHLARLDIADGQPVSGFNGGTDGNVLDLALAPDRATLYVAGSFTKIDGHAQPYLAGIDAATGSTLDADMNLAFTGTRDITDPIKGTFVARIDVDASGDRLLATGNFTNVDGANPARNQIALVNLGTSPDSLANWETDRYTPLCVAKFLTYVRDIDFSPNGDYFIVTGTGATAINHGGSPLVGPPCDATSRFETYASGSHLEPTWITYVGGDTNYSTAVTGAAVYLGGHERWQNNYWGKDTAGPGSVGRPGIAALSPVNGLPFSWNPTRKRGLGAQALLATNPEGLWVGSDTDTIGGEYHAKIALMPLAGGETEPPADPGILPAQLYAVQDSGDVVARSFDGAILGSPSTAWTGWSAARGGFMLSGQVYAGWTDGSLYRWHVTNGTVLGNRHTVGLRGLDTYTKLPTGVGFAAGHDPQINQYPNMGINNNVTGTANGMLPNATGTFYDPTTKRLYYTEDGAANFANSCGGQADECLYYRAFLPEDGLLGDYQYVACSANGTANVPSCPSGFDPAAIRGLTLAGGELYFGTSSGGLYSMAFTSSTGTPTGSATLVNDTIDWSHTRGLFLRSDQP